MEYLGQKENTINVLYQWLALSFNNRIGGIMFSVLASSAVDRDYMNWYLLLLREAHTIKENGEDWLDRNQYNVSEWSDKSIRGLVFFCELALLKIQLCVLVQYKADLIIMSLKIKLFSPWYSWKIAELALSNNHSLTIFQHSSDLHCPVNMVCYS